MCGPAHTSCYTRCFLENGTWTHVEGCPQAGNNGVFGSRSLCAKGNAAMQTLSAKDRLLYPKKRIGAKGAGARFERISWDEALDIIADTLLDQKKRFGPESYGILSPQAFPVLAHVGRRFLNVHGSPNYLHSAICFMQRNAAANTVVGGPTVQRNNGTEPHQLDKTNLLVCWGFNAENSAVNQGWPRAFLQAKKRGMRTIDIRPMRDPLASAADTWLPVRPGTDLALALGILNVIVTEDLYDHDAVEKTCYGFDELAQHVRQFTPAWASLHCGIPAETIHRAAVEMATVKPMGIKFGNGIGDQSSDGFWTVCAVQLIGAITGNIGTPGGGADTVGYPMLIPFDGRPKTAPELLPKSPEDEANGWQAGTSKLVCPEFPRWYSVPGGGGPTSGYFGGLMSVLTGEPYPLRAVFAHSTNPLSATRQPKLVEQALRTVDFFFAMDMFANPSHDFADLVLPACSAYECSHQMAVRNMPEGTFIGMNQMVQPAPAETMSDWEFYFKLAERMGYGDRFWNGDIEAYLAEIAAPTGYTLDQLRNAPDGIFVPRPEGAKPRMTDPDTLFSDLPHGKVQCKNEVVGGKPDTRGVHALPFLPEYRGPAEGLAETPAIAAEFPLVFSDVHAWRTCNHGYYNDVPWLRELQPEPWVRINPATARRYGIPDGSWIRVESPHGYVKLKAQYFEGISPEVLMARRGWWQPCESLDLPGYGYADGGAETNVLYSSDPTTFDRFNSSMGKQTLVKISLWEEN